MSKIAIGKQVINALLHSPTQSFITKPKTIQVFADELKYAGDTLALNSKNTVYLKSVGRKFGYDAFSFYDGKQKIGSALISKGFSYRAKGEVPDNWFIEGGVPNEYGFYPLKPNIKVEELLMTDKIGMVKYEHRSSGKKYGTMCMQRILEWAEQNGFGSRITLQPAKHGSSVEPGEFYAKIGFNVSPKRVTEIETQIAKGKRTLEYINKNRDKLDDDLIEEMLMGIWSHEPNINGRYFGGTGNGDVFLTHPEILRNYLK